MSAEETFGATRGRLLMQQVVDADGSRHIYFQWYPPDAQFAVVSRDVMDELLRHVDIENVEVHRPPLR